MPIVTIVMHEGRTLEQKRKLVKAVTETIVKSLAPGATVEGTEVIISEVKKENIARGGVLHSDR